MSLISDQKDFKVSGRLKAGEDHAELELAEEICQAKVVKAGKCLFHLKSSLK